MKKCPEIARNYRLYKDLIATKKHTSTQNLLLIDRSETSLWKEKITALKHDDSSNTVDLAVAKQNNDLKYRLKLFIRELIDEPVLYFDSDGPPIRNTNPLTRLTESKIRTPHISYYDEQGFAQAQRDDYIEAHEADLQKDINTGMAYFCSAINVNTDTVVPRVTEFLPLFPISQNTDVHAGVVFSCNQSNAD